MSEQTETLESQDTPPIDTEVNKLKLELEKVKAERDLFKKERDEANDTLRTMKEKPADTKSEFDKIFNGGE